MNRHNRLIVLDHLKRAFKETTLTLAESKPDIQSDDILALAHIRFAIDLLEQDSQTRGGTP